MLAVVGIAVAFGVSCGEDRPAAGPVPETPLPSDAGAAFDHFAANCLTGHHTGVCWREARLLLGTLGAAEEQAAARADRLEATCAKDQPPPSCARKDETLSALRALQSTLAAYADTVLRRYPNAAPASPGTRPGPPPGETVTGSVEQTDRTWVCNGPVRLDSVTVTITPEAPRHQGVGIRLDAGCTGTIETIHVVNAVGDGIDVHDARDLTINGGSIVCNGRAAAAHQDGIQAMGGSNVVFRHLHVNCPTASNAGFYVNAIPGRRSVPDRILFVDGRIEPTQSATVFIGRHQTGSGVMNSVLCRSRYFAFRAGEGADVVNRRNTISTDC